MNPDPAQEALTALAADLVERTKAGTVKWTGDSRLVSFSLVTRKGSIVISSRDNDGQAPFDLSVLNAKGTAIQWLSSEWWRLEPQIPETEPAPWNETLETLYRLARANAVDLEGVIGGILEEIDNPTADFPSSPTDDIPF